LLWFKFSQLINIFQGVNNLFFSLNVDPKHNGAEGIGTGWSTNIPCFNPKDIVENIIIYLPIPIIILVFPLSFNYRNF